MPYKNIANLPNPIRNVLPTKAEEIYQKAFNNAYEQYADTQKRKMNGSREDTARRVAWAAVKNVYQKNEKTGKWELKK